MLLWFSVNQVQLWSLIASATAFVDLAVDRDFETSQKPTAAGDFRTQGVYLKLFCWLFDNETTEQVVRSKQDQCELVHGSP